MSKSINITTSWSTSYVKEELAPINEYLKEDGVDLSISPPSAAGFMAELSVAIVGGVSVYLISKLIDLVSTRILKPKERFTLVINNIVFNLPEQKLEAIQHSMNIEGAFPLKPPKTKKSEGVEIYIPEDLDFTTLKLTPDLEAVLSRGGISYEPHEAARAQQALLFQYIKQISAIQIYIPDDFDITEFTDFHYLKSYFEQKGRVFDFEKAFEYQIWILVLYCRQRGIEIPEDEIHSMINEISKKDDLCVAAEKLVSKLIAKQIKAIQIYIPDDFDITEFTDDQYLKSYFEQKGELFDFQKACEYQIRILVLYCRHKEIEITVDEIESMMKEVTTRENLRVVAEKLAGKLIAKSQ